VGEGFSLLLSLPLGGLRRGGKKSFPFWEGRGYRLESDKTDWC